MLRHLSLIWCQQVFSLAIWSNKRTSFKTRFRSLDQLSSKDLPWASLTLLLEIGENILGRSVGLDSKIRCMVLGVGISLPSLELKKQMPSGISVTQKVVLYHDLVAGCVAELALPARLLCTSALYGVYKGPWPMTQVGKPNQVRVEPWRPSHPSGAPPLSLSPLHSTDPAD